MGNDIFNQTRAVIDKSGINLQQARAGLHFFARRRQRIDAAHADNRQAPLQFSGETTDHFGAA